MHTHFALSQKRGSHPNQQHTLPPLTVHTLPPLLAFTLMQWGGDRGFISSFYILAIVSGCPLQQSNVRKKGLEMTPWSLTALRTRPSSCHAQSTFCHCGGQSADPVFAWDPSELPCSEGALETCVHETLKIPYTDRRGRAQGLCAAQECASSFHWEFS